MKPFYGMKQYRYLHAIKTRTRKVALKFAKAAKKRGMQPVLFGGGLKHYVAVYVPSTKSYNKPISRAAFKKRTREVEAFLSKRFGGETTYRTRGGYIGKRGFVSEPINVVKAYGTGKQLMKYRRDVLKLARVEKKKWGQEAVSIESDSRLKFI